MRHSFGRVLSVSSVVCALLVFPQPAFAQQPAPSTACSVPTADPVTDVALPGHPFRAIATPDGCWFFVSMQGNPPFQSGVAVVRRMDGEVTLERVVPLEPSVELRLSRDGQMLMVANGDYVDFLDTERLKSGQGDPKLGRIYGGPGSFQTNVNTTPGDEYLFVSDHAVTKETATVYNLERARNAGFQGDFKIGSIRAGREVLAILFPPDPRHVYIVSEEAAVNSTWPRACPQNVPNKLPLEGIVTVVDLERAKTDPANSILSRVKAGCVSVRMAVSPEGDRLYVTARADDALVVLDTTKFISDPDNAKIAVVPVGSTPQGVTVIEGGAKLVVTNTGSASLSVIDAARVTLGAGALIGTIPVGTRPRDATVTEDGRTLFVANFDSNSLQLIDLERLELEPPE